MTPRELAEAVMRDLDCADVFGHRDELTESVERHMVSSLDSAWDEAVAALPDKWLGPNLSAYYPTGWEADAHHEDAVPGSGRGPRASGACFGETPEAALRALIAALAARPKALA